jgi:hypothetical protein
VIGAPSSAAEAADQLRQHCKDPSRENNAWANRRDREWGETRRGGCPTSARDGPRSKVVLDIRCQSFDSYCQTGVPREDAVPTKPMVTTLWVPAMVRTLRDAGWSDGRIASAVGLRRDQVELQRRIPLDKYCALLDFAAEVSGDPHFGLHFGARHAFVTAGLLSYIMRNSPSVGAALTNTMRYVRLHVDATELSLAFAGPEARLVYRLTDPSIRPSRHYDELLMVCFLRFIRLGIDDSWSPRVVHFRHPAPADLAPCQGLFGAPVRFAQSDNAMLFDR